MRLTTKTEKNKTLTMQEMDNNLEFLSHTKSTRKTLESRTLINDTEILCGTYTIDYTPSGSTIPIKYGENLEYTLEGEFGYSYHINATLGVINSAGIYSSKVFNSSLNSNMNYVLGNKTFLIGSGFNSYINTIAIQSDGKIFVGGGFGAYNNVASNYIIRLNTDGSYDSTFVTGSGFNGGVLAIAIQTDGKIVVGGDFMNYNGVASNYIIRLNTDGSYDSTFVTGSGFNGGVSTIAIQTDGKILVGGGFMNYNGVASNYIIRLNVDGSKDTSFNIGTGFNNYINTIAIQSDGKILVGGGFMNYNYIARLNADGSKDTSFNTGFGFNGGVSTIAIQTDGKIFVGGGFGSYNGNTSNSVIRLNTNGSIDTSFNIGSGINAGGSVKVIVVQSDGKIVVGGVFSSYNAVTSQRIARLNSDGSYDSTFITGSGFDDRVLAIAIQSNGKILVGGAFSSYNAVTSQRIIRLNTDGTNDTLSTTQTKYVLTSTDSNYKLDVVDNKIHITTNGTIMDYMILNYTLIKTYGQVAVGSGSSGSIGS